jgi:hypothetical protein
MEACRGERVTHGNRSLILHDLIKEYNILEENIYNMDEKGIQLGIGARVHQQNVENGRFIYNII